MTSDEESMIRIRAEFAPGLEIEALQDGQILHRGRVEDIVPGHGLFWIMDICTGGRKLLDSAEFDEIRPTRVPSPSTASDFQ